MYVCRIKELSSRMGKCLIALQYVAFEYQRCLFINISRVFPVELTQLSHSQPEKLYLDNKKLTFLPPELGVLSKLQVLRVDNNMLASVPASALAKIVQDEGNSVFVGKYESAVQQLISKIVACKYSPLVSGRNLRVAVICDSLQNEKQRKIKPKQFRTTTDDCHTEIPTKDKGAVFTGDDFELPMRKVMGLVWPMSWVFSSGIYRRPTMDLSAMEFMFGWSAKTESSK
ncbi:hypothetical protein K1719_004157 [Acacia pycnantha]|nr:hypothetical protein K1719_004157 [Acacia pycnantha]